MPAWSFAAIRPKLDRFFDSVRTSLEARASSGVDRRRLEDFLTQTQALQARLYACLESADRSDLPAVLKDIQVLAYRTRVLFGSPLPGVAWDDLQRLLAGLPQPEPLPMRVLDGPAVSGASGELRAPRPQPAGPERTLVAPAATAGGGELTAPAPAPFPTAVLASEPSPGLPVPADAPPAMAPSPPPEAEASVPEEPPADDSPADAPSPAGETISTVLADATALPLRIPYLMGVLVFLLGAIAGYALGGMHPLFTALASGFAAILVTRAERASVRYNEESAGSGLAIGSETPTH